MSVNPNARAFPLLFLCLSLLLCSPVAARQKEFTIDDVYNGAFYGNLPDIQDWLKDGKHYLSYGSDGNGYVGILRVDARTGDSEPFLDNQKLEAALIATGVEKAEAARLSHLSHYTLNRDEDSLLLESDGDFYWYRIPEGKAVRLTSSPEAKKIDATFSPDGKHIAFTQANDLYIADVEAPGKVRRLTRDGSNKILNGKLDWVYEEEVYGRGRTQGFEWSPDSRRIAFLRIDDTPVKSFPIVDHLPHAQNIEHWDYPLAGDPNPVISLGTVPADGSTPPRFFDLSKYPADNRLLVRFAWLPNARKVTFQVQPRNATFLDLNIADPDTGKITTLFQEKTPAWVEIIENPTYLSDGTFLWLSDRTGYRHIYHYRADGTLIGAITHGDWDVRTLYGVNSKEEFVYFSASEHSPIADHAYKARIVNNSAPVRLTQQEGDHTVRFSPDFALFVDTRSEVTTPSEMRVIDGSDGKELQILTLNPEAKQAISRYRFSRPELLTVKARDGFVMEAELIRPPDFDPKKKYPVWMEVYAGPASQTVRNQWDWSMWHQLLAQKGYIVWECDNRSASAKGAKSTWTSYKKFGIGELADIEDSLSYLKSLPYVDSSRIGITGWSFGGFMTEFALTHSNSFKCGFAGAGVSDWHLYDTIYTERYMDSPKANAEGYRVTSVVEAAGKGAGKLMIVHGMMDDNVHLQNSIQLIYALQKAGRGFDMMLYPSPASRHRIDDPALARHLQKLELKFIQDNL